MASGDQNEMPRPEIWDQITPDQVAISYLKSAFMKPDPRLDAELDAIEKNLDRKPDRKFEVALAMLDERAYESMNSPDKTPDRVREFVVAGLTAGFDNDNADVKRERLTKIADISGRIVFMGSFITGKDLETFADNIKGKIDTEEAEIKTFWNKLQGDIQASKEDFQTYE